MTVHREHGIEREDPYYWLNQKENPEVIAHLEAENAYCAAHQAHLADTRKVLYDEMLGRIQEADTSAPVHRSGYWYYTRTQEGLAYSIHCRKKGTMEASEEIYLDENVLADGLKYFKMIGMTVSPDHTHVAWLADIDGGERFVLYVKNLETNQILPEQITELKWGLAWAADNETLFFCRSDDAQRPHKIFRWNIHSATTDEVEVCHEPDERYFMTVSTTRDHAWVLLGCHSKQTSLIRAVSGLQPTSEPVIIRERKPEVEYHVAHRDGYFYILLNDDAKNFKIVRRLSGDVTAPEEEVVAHNEQVYLTDWMRFKTTWSSLNALRAYLEDGSLTSTREPPN
jgi:oligopeptidase B